MWSDLLAENTNRATNRAAALRTDCSRRNSVPDTPTMTARGGEGMGWDRRGGTGGKGGFSKSSPSKKILDPSLLL